MTHFLFDVTSPSLGVKTEYFGVIRNIYNILKKKRHTKKITFKVKIIILLLELKKILIVVFKNLTFVML
jgi:hypothetical protein